MDALKLETFKRFRSMGGAFYTLEAKEVLSFVYSLNVGDIGTLQRLDPDFYKSLLSYAGELKHFASDDLPPFDA